MRTEDIIDFRKFIDELSKETDRGLPLVSMALIDEKLRDTLESFFIEGEVTKKLLDEFNSPLGSLSSRLTTCYALGLIDDYEYSEINILRKVRNEFAHLKHGINFSTEKIKGLCSSLKSQLPEGEDYPLNNPRFRFRNAVICIVLRLIYRPEWVLKEKRLNKNWSQGNDKWIPFKEQQPPEGMPIIAMAKKD